MSLLLIDNYDSFTYNLVQMLGVLGAEIEVIRNDAAGATELLTSAPRGIVLSPGPGRPENAGVCIDLLRLEPNCPVLGVCLGHQALGVAFGGEIGSSPRLMHGKTSRIRHDGEGILGGLPNPFTATRYHSLEVVPETLPRDLESTAFCEDDRIMAMRHRRHPYWGVQFHPESILTEVGPSLLANFLRVCGVGSQHKGRSEG